MDDRAPVSMHNGQTTSVSGRGRYRGERRSGGATFVMVMQAAERTWITGNAWYHSDQLRVIERIRRPSLNYLEYQFTIDDPKVLTKRWTSAWRKFSLAQDDDCLLENYCTNEQNAAHLRKLAEQEAGRAK